jgi:hypothetical protein
MNEWHEVQQMHSSPNASADVRLKLNGPIFVAVENWRRSQQKIPCRSDAIRQLVQQGLGDAERHDRAGG